MPPSTSLIFAERFAQLRRRHRISMRQFQEEAGVGPSYVHDVEKGLLFPSRAKLEALVAVLASVAEEQGLEDPHAGAQELLRLREVAPYVDRLGVEPAMAQVFVRLRALGEMAGSDNVESLSHLLDDVSVQEFTAALRFATALEEVEAQSRADLMEHISKALDSFLQETPQRQAAAGGRSSQGAS